MGQTIKTERVFSGVLTEEQRADLKAVAERNHRSVAAEVSIAILRHVNMENRNAPAASLPESAAEAST